MCAAKSGFASTCGIRQATVRGYSRLRQNNNQSSILRGTLPCVCPYRGPSVAWFGTRRTKERCESTPACSEPRFPGLWAACSLASTPSSSPARSTRWFACTDLSPQEKGFTVAIGLVGTVIGALGAGQVGQRLGSRETLRITAVLYVVSALGCGLAWNWPSFMVFRFIGGLGIGASSVLAPVYIAELAPAKWRGRLVAAFQFNVVFGIMVAYISNYAIRTMHLGAAEWRWQVGIAAVPALVFLALLFGIPRSPRWSASKNRMDEALAVLKMMGDPDPEAELADIQAALAQEHATAHERVFQWKYRYPLFLAITIGAFNQLAGINAILYYLNNIFAAAGFSQISSDQQAIAIGATNFLFTIVGMSLIDKLGRKTLLLIGAAGCASCLAEWPGCSPRNRIAAPCCGCWSPSLRSSAFRRAQ